MTEILRATATVANEVTNRTMPLWLKVTGAVFSVATFASLGAAYLLFKTKTPVTNRSIAQHASTPEVEATWRVIFERLGELAFEIQVPLGVVPRYCTNTFRANAPNEDALMSFVFCDGEGAVRSLFGVFDGHSTKAASQFASEELPGFIERRLRVLDMQEKRLKAADAPPASQLKFCHERPKLIKEALVSAFLDADRFFLCESIILHLINGGQRGATRTSLERCFSGTCANIVLIDRGVLYCANAGDCRAVLGVEIEVEETEEMDGFEKSPFLRSRDTRRTTIIGSVLSNDHNTDNQREMARIRQDHPNEADLFSSGRIKGILKPTRHIGGALLKEPIARRFVKGDSLTEDWQPPYTTALPEVSYRTLTRDDKFIIIGTDGLWDLLSNQEAVSLVVEYEVLRSENLIPKELNVCTFIIERALSRATLPRHPSSANDSRPSSVDKDAEMDEEDPHSELSHLCTILSLPAHQRRDIYDDISVVVIYLETGRREQAGTAMAALGNWPCPSFPGSVDRVSKLKKAVPLAKPLSRLLSSGTSESLLIKAYLEECWPDRFLDRWTSQGLTTRKFLKSFGIDLPSANLPLNSKTCSQTSLQVSSSSSSSSSSPSSSSSLAASSSSLSSNLPSSHSNRSYEHIRLSSASSSGSNTINSLTEQLPAAPSLLDLGPTVFDTLPERTPFK